MMTILCRLVGNLQINGDRPLPLLYFQMKLVQMHLILSYLASFSINITWTFTPNTFPTCLKCQT